MYLTASFLAGGLEALLKTLAFCILPTACIWFPEPLGDYTGLFLLDSITSPSPALFVWAMGWLVLLLPAIVVIVWWLQGVPF